MKIILVQIIKILLLATVMGYCRKNPNRWGRRGRLRIYFFEPPPSPLEFFIFLLYPWKFQTKQSSTPGYSTKLCQIPWQFQHQKQRPLEIPHYFFLVTLGNSTLFLIQKGGAHKYVWLASRDQSNFCSKVRVRWSAPIKTEKKLKGRFISIRHLLVIETCIFLT